MSIQSAPLGNAQACRYGRSSSLAIKAVLALAAVLVALAFSLWSSEDALAGPSVPGQPTDWTDSYSPGTTSEVKWGITNPRVTNVNSLEAYITVDLWTASATTFSASGVGWELWLDGYMVGSGTFSSRNTGGWNNANGANCTKNTSIKTRNISKNTSQRRCQLVLVIKYKGGTYNYGNAPVCYLPAATRYYLSNGSLTFSPSNPTVGSTITATYSLSGVPTGSLLIYWYRDNTLVQGGDYSTTSSRRYTVTGADRGHTIKCEIVGDTDALVGSKTLSKYIDPSIASQSIANGWYWINNNYGKYADVNGPGTGAYVKNYSQNWTAAQLFYLEGNSSSGYYIRTTWGTAWNVPGGTSGDYENSPIHNWTYPNTTRWKFGARAGSYGQIQAVLGAQRLLGVMNDSSANNAEFVLHSAANATWRLTKANVNSTGTISGSGKLGSPISFTLQTVGDLNLYNSTQGCYKVTYQVLRNGSQTNMPWGELTAGGNFTGSYTPTDADAGSTISVRIAVRTTDGLLIDDVTTSGIAIEKAYQPPSGTIQNGWYYIQRQSDGKVLNLDDMKVENNATVHLSQRYDNLECVWYVSGNSDGSYTIRNAAGYALDQTGGAEWAESEGYWVKTYQNNGSAAQRWYLSMNGANQYGNIVSQSMQGWYLSTFDDGSCPCISKTDKENWRFVPANVSGTSSIPSPVYAPESSSETYTISASAPSWNLFCDDVPPIYRAQWVETTYQYYVGGTLRSSGSTCNITSADVGKQVYCLVSLKAKNLAEPIAQVKTASVTIQRVPASAAITEGWYYIQDQKSGLYLDVANGSGAYAGANVQLYDPTNAANQLWYVSGNKTSGYTIRNTSGYALDVADAVDENGTNVWVANYNGSAAQRWNITSPVGVYGIIQSKLPAGRYLGLQDDGTENGTNVLVWSEAQARFRLVRADTGISVNLAGETMAGTEMIGRVQSANWGLFGVYAPSTYYSVEYRWLRDGKAVAGMSGTCPFDTDNFTWQRYTSKSSDENHYYEIEFRVMSKFGTVISPWTKSNPISVLPQGTATVTGGDTLYYTRSSLVEAISGGKVATTEYPVNSTELSVVTFDRVNGSFRLKNLSLSRYGTGQLYDLVVTVNSQTNQAANGSVPQVPGVRNDSVYFAFCKPNIYPSNEEFQGNDQMNNATDKVAMWMKTWYYRTNVTMKLVEAGTNTPANFRMWGRISDIDIMPGYTENEWGGSGDPSEVAPTAYYEGSEFVRLKSAGSISVMSSSVLMQDSANKSVYAPKRHENDRNGSNLYAALLKSSSSNGTIQLEYGGTNCGVNYNFEAFPTSTGLKKPSLSITKNADGTRYKTGDTVTYTLRINNKNGDVTNAYNVKVTDTLPSGLSYMSATATLDNGSDGERDLFTDGTPSVSRSGSALTISQSALGGDDTIVVTIKARVTKTTSGSITNTGYAQCDDSSRVSASDTITVEGTTVERAALSVTKSVSPTSAEAGDTVTYSILVRNTSNIAATNVRVTDTLPSSLTPVSTSRGTLSGNNLTYNHGTLAAGSSFSITVRATVKAGYEGTTVTNWAYATCSNGGGDNDSASFTIPGKPALDVSKSADAASYTVGDTVTWTVVVRNSTPGTTAQNVKITDLVPAGVTVTNATATSTDGTPTVSRSGNDVTVTQPSLAYGKTISVSIVGTANAAGSFKNTAQATTSNGSGGEASSTITVAEPEKPAISVEKIADKDVYSVGDTVTYYVTVANNSGVDAQNVKVTDTLPSNLKAISSDIGELSGNTWSYSVALMNSGASVTATIKAEAVTAGTGVVNTASATCSNGTGGSDDATIDIVRPALSVEKLANGTEYYKDDTVTYTVTVKNTVKGSVAKNVKVTDALPEELALVSADAVSTDGTAEVETGDNAVTATCDTLAYGEELRVTIEAKAIAAGEVTNTASATAENGDPGKDDETVTVKERTPELSVVKDADRDTYKIGDEIVYTITVTNIVPQSSAHNVSVSDSLPAQTELADVTATATSGTPAVQKAGNGFTVTLAELAGEESITVTVKAKAVAIGTAVNTAIADSDNTEPGKDDETVTVTPTDTTLSVDKTADADSYYVGDAVTYTIKVTNAGSSPALNVTMTDFLPAYMKPAEGTVAELHDGDGTLLASWDAMPENGVFAVEGDTTLDAGETWTYTIHAVVVEPGMGVENTAIADSDNSEPSEDTETVDLIAPKLAIEKTASAARAQVGDAVTYTVTLRNSGTAPVLNATITDVMPANMTWTAPAVLKDGKGAVLATWNTEPADGVYAVDGGLTIPAGEQVVLTVKAVAASAGTAVNTAVGAGESEKGEPVGPVEDDATVPVAMPEVSVTKTADKGYYQVGETITWTITVTNSAAGTTAKNVTVSDRIPAGIEGATASVGSIVNGTFTWNVGELAYGETKSATISGTATEAAIGNVTNTAVVKHDDGETESSVTTPVVNPDTPTLAVEKTSDKPDYQVGDEVTYTVNVTNISEDTGRPLTGNIRIDVSDNGTDYPRLTAVVTGAPSDAQLAYQWYHGDEPISGRTSSSYYFNSTDYADGVSCVVIDGSGKYVGELRSGEATATYRNAVWQAATIAFRCVNWPAGATSAKHSYTMQNMDSYPTRAELDQAIQERFANPPASCKKCSWCGASTRGEVRSYFTRNVTLLTWNVSGTSAGATASPANVAENVVVSDLVPEGIEVSNATATSTDGTPAVKRDGNDVTVSQAELAPGESITVTIVGTAVAEGTGIVNTAKATTENGAGDEDDATIDVNNAKVSIEKTADAESYQVGDTITWKITVENTAAGTTAHNVVVTDAIPAGVEGAQADKGTIENGTLTWNVGELEYGSPQTATVTVKATAAGIEGIENTAHVKHDGGEDEDAVTVDVTNPAIAIEKSADKQTVKVGETVTYSITMTNTGSEPVYDAAITDAMPANMTWTAPAVLKDVRGATLATWNEQPEGGVYAVQDGLELAPGQAVVLTVKATANADGDAVNTAVGTADDEDGKPVGPVDDDATVDVTTPGVHVKKTADKVQYQVGDTVTWTITVSNDVLGTTATGVVVTDAIPAGIEGASASAGTIEDGTLTWNVGELAYGEVKTVTVTGTVTEDAVGRLENTAVVKHDDGEDEDEETVEVIGKTPWTLTKTADKDEYHPGETIDWTVTLARGKAETSKANAMTVEQAAATLPLVNGADNADAVEVTERPAAAAGDGASPLANFVGWGDYDYKITGEPIVGTKVTISFRPDPSLVGIVKPQYRWYYAPFSGTPYIVEFGSNSPTATVPEAALGMNLHVEISDATGHANIDLVFAIGRVGYKLSGSAGIQGSAQVGSTLNAVLSGLPKDCGDLELTWYSGSKPGATDKKLGTGSTLVLGSETEGAYITVTATDPTQNYRGTLTATTGPVAESSAPFTMKDSLQLAGVLDAQIDGAAMTPEQQAWVAEKAGELMPGESISWHVTGTVADDAPETIVNNATATLEDGTELKAESTVKVVHDVDLEVDKTADAAQYKPGDTVTYTIDGVNNGPDSTIGWKVYDKLPEGLAFESATVAYKTADNVVNTYDAEAEYYSFPTGADPADYVLKAGEHVYVTVKAKVTDAVKISNTARFEALYGDPAEDTVEVTAEAPVVEIEKIADAEKYKVGDVVTWTVTVQNTTPGTTAHNVVVTDELPAGVADVVASDGAIADGTFTWNVGELAYGETKSVTLSGTVTDEAGKTLTNAAAVKHDDGEDEDEVTVDIEHPIPTFDVDKTSDADVYSLGDTVNYTIIVTNTSEYPAEDVTVTDTMPDSLTPTSASMGTISGQTVTATIDHMDPGETVIITVSATANAAGTVTNQVTVTCEGAEPVDDETIVEVKKPVLDVTKTASADTVRPGDEVSWTITVENTVPGTTAHNVIVTDKIPAGFVNAASEGATIENGTLTWNVGDLPYGKKVTLTVVGNVADDYRGEITNVAVADGDNTDPAEGEDTIGAQKQYKVTYVRDVSDALPQGEKVFEESAYDSDVYQVNPDATAAADREDCYRFDGWYLDPECTKPYTPGPLTGDLTLYSKNYAKVSFEWATGVEFPELTEPQYRIPEDPGPNYTPDTSIGSLCFDPYALPSWKQPDGSEANWTEVAWGTDYEMPTIKDPHRATWAGRDWIEWHARGWYDNPAADGSPHAPFGGKFTVTGDSTHWANVTHSRYQGSIG